MGLNISDKNVWRSFVHAIVAQPYNCPVVHYLPIKFARYYMENLFPTWNFTPMEEACRSAEFSYSTQRLRKNHFSPDMLDFAKILNQKLNVDVKILVEFDNLLLVDFAVLPEKVAILYQDSTQSQYDNQEISTQMYDLRASILESNGWGVLRVNQIEFENQGLEKFDWLKAKFEEVYQKQQEVYKSEELDRWGYSINKMEQIGSQATLETERHRDSGINIEF